MTIALITLEEWSKRYFDASSRPSAITMRRWATMGKLTPSPKKIGRSWFVEPDTQFVGQTRSDRGKRATTKA